MMSSSTNMYIPLESLPDAALIADGSGTVVAINALLAGIAPGAQTLVGKSLSLLVPQLCGQHLPMLPNPLRLTATIQQVPVEVTLSALDGERFLCLLRPLPDAPRDDRAEWIAEMEDVLKRKESELHLLQFALEKANDAVLITDGESIDLPGPRIVYVNESFEKMTGYCRDEVIGKTPRILQGPKTDRTVLDMMRGKITAWEPFQVELLNYTKDGREFWVELNMRRVPGQDWTASYWVAIQRDITERKKMTAQMLQNEKMIALGGLIAGVAHEINNPLSVVSATAQLLALHPDDAVRTDAASIRKMTERMGCIVHSLLTFARGSDEDERTHARLGDLVEEATGICRYSLNQSDIELVLSLADDAGNVYVNTNQIQQIIMNLLHNAAYAVRTVPAERRRIVITTGSRNNRAFLMVADSGSGMSESVRARIFEPFFTTKEVGEGTGLGLSVCHGIARAHNGTLEVESTEGVGTTFTLTLPLAAQVRSEIGCPLWEI